MNRRDALKSLAALAGATGLTVTPVTTQEASDAAIILLTTDKCMSQDQVRRLKAAWADACQGTDLQSVKTFVLSDGLRVEIVRGPIVRRG